MKYWFRFVRWFMMETRLCVGMYFIVWAMGTIMCFAPGLSHEVHAMLAVIALSIIAFMLICCLTMFQLSKTDIAVRQFWCTRPSK